MLTTSRARVPDRGRHVRCRLRPHDQRRAPVVQVYDPKNVFRLNQNISPARVPA
jgi:hypothetical protein